MIILAVLLLVVVAAVVAFVLIGGLEAAPAEMSVGALDVSASPLWFFVLGAVTLLAAELALALLRGGSRRKLAKRRELKRLREVEAHAAPGAGAGTTRSSAPPSAPPSGPRATERPATGGPSQSQSPPPPTAGGPTAGGPGDRSPAPPRPLGSGGATAGPGPDDPTWHDPPTR